MTSQESREIRESEDPPAPLVPLAPALEEWAGEPPTAMVASMVLWWVGGDGDVVRAMVGDDGDNGVYGGVGS